MSTFKPFLHVCMQHNRSAGVQSLRQGGNNWGQETDRGLRGSEGAEEQLAPPQSPAPCSLMAPPLPAQCAWKVGGRSVSGPGSQWGGVQPATREGAGLLVSGAPPQLLRPQLAEPSSHSSPSPPSTHPLHTTRMRTAVHTACSKLHSMLTSVLIHLWYSRQPVAPTNAHLPPSWLFCSWPWLWRRLKKQEKRTRKEGTMTSLLEWNKTNTAIPFTRRT